MRTIRLLILVLPWVIIIGFLVFYQFDNQNKPSSSITSTTVLQQIEPLGKLELVKYNFKEITELEELSEKYLKIFQLGPDSKIALISQGEAVGCIDLTRLKNDDISVKSDTLYVQLPEPEICYFKLDMDKTKIYSLQTNPLKDEKAFIQRAYKQAEEQIKASALESGILDQTKKNARLILKPMFEKISGKTVVFTQRPQPAIITRER